MIHCNKTITDANVIKYETRSDPAVKFLELMHISVFPSNVLNAVSQNSHKIISDDDSDLLSGESFRVFDSESFHEARFDG